MISVVIPAYNEEKRIVACLDSLTKQTTKIPFEVILVNNNSTDKTVEVAKTFVNNLNLKIIHEKRKGRGAARWTGFQEAKGDIIFSTDADAIVPEYWIEKLLLYFQNPQVFAVSGTARVADCSPFQNWFISTGQPITMLGYRLFFHHYWLSGFNFAIRKEIYLKAGGFDPHLNAFEDTDLAYRVRELGKIQFVKNVPITMSGRRFRNGSIRGLFSYMPRYFAHKITKRDKEAYMSDVR